MINIFEKIPAEGQRNRAWLIGLIAITYITICMILGNSGDADASLIHSISATYLLVMQGALSCLLFIVPPIIIIKSGLHLRFRSFFSGLPFNQIVFTVFITISFMVVGSLIAEWNMNLDFPGNSSWETWARQSEENLKVLTEHLTNFTSTTQFVFAFIVIGIVAGVGDELLVRGLFQCCVADALGSGRVGGWMSAFVLCELVR
ncbi:MAG: hypothetical protein AAF789_03560, partial [Bacteroidota bacterium]